MQINNQLSIDIWEMVLYLQGKYGLACKKRIIFSNINLKQRILIAWWHDFDAQSKTDIFEMFSW